MKEYEIEDFVNDLYFLFKMDLLNEIKKHNDKIFLKLKNDEVVKISFKQ